MSNPAEPEEERRASGREAQATAAERRDRWKREITSLQTLFAEGHPEVPAPKGIDAHLMNFKEARTVHEWNLAVAGLVASLLHSLGGDRSETVRYRLLTGRLANILTRGFVPPAEKETNRALLRRDSWIIEHERPATLADAAKVLDAWDRASLLPGQSMQDEPAKKRLDRLRKRARKAAAHAGFEFVTRRKLAPE